MHDPLKVERCVAARVPVVDGPEVPWLGAGSGCGAYGEVVFLVVAS